MTVHSTEPELPLLDWVRPIITLCASVGVLLLTVHPVGYTQFALHVALVPAVLYPVLYSFAPWHRTPTGRALMNMSLSVALLIALRALHMDFVLPHFDYVYGLAITYLGCALTYQLAVMLEIKRVGRLKVRRRLEEYR